jgi:hypothetical protein
MAVIFSATVIIECHATCIKVNPSALSYYTVTNFLNVRVELYSLSYQSNLLGILYATSTITMLTTAIINQLN